jgi:hypothetical protein
MEGAGFEAEGLFLGLFEHVGHCGVLSGSLRCRPVAGRFSREGCVADIGRR